MTDALVSQEPCEVTVVIVSLVGGTVLQDCQAALRALRASVITIDTTGSCFDAAGVALSNSGVRNVPGRRREALRHVRTRFVVFVEDVVRPGEHWLSSIGTALGQNGVAAIGGPVVISPLLPWRYQALGLTEYARFHERNFCSLSDPSSRPDAVTSLPGANFAFHTECLREVLVSDQDGLVDNEVFSRLRKSGYILVYEPAMAVAYSHAHVAGASLSARFNHGRIYASRLYAKAGARKKLIGALKALLLPPILFMRTLRESRRSRQFHWGAMLWVAAMHLYWSAGEFVGIVIGDDVGVERWT